MGRGRARCAGNGVFVVEALVFCGRGIGVFVQFRGRVIGVFVIVALGFSSTFVVAALVFLCYDAMLTIVDLHRSSSW